MRKRKLLFGIPIVLALMIVVLASGQVGTDDGCWVIRETIYVYGNAGFTFDNGITSGCGTKESPYVIEGLRIVAIGCDYGINIEKTSSHFIIRNCIIEGAAGAAIRLHAASNGRIEGCQLIRNERAILLDAADRNAIVGNLIVENHYGVSLLAGSGENTVSKNTFVDNGRAGQDPGGRNLWYCGAIGNYWDEYDGPDKNYDGIGDTPLYSPVVDRYPLMISPWQCVLPLTETASQCATATDVLQEIAVSTTVVPCGPVPACEPVCPPPACAPTVTCCNDQILTCANPQATLTAEFCPSGPACEPCRVEWTRAGFGIVGTVPTITVSEPGTYTVTIIGADGCSVSDVVVVGADFDPPTVAATADGSLSCAVTEVGLEAHISGGRPPYTLQWTTPGGGILGCEPDIAVHQPGTYRVTATGVNGCSASATVTVTQDIETPVVTASAGGSLSCAITEVALSATISGGRPPYGIVWSKPGVDLIGSTETIVVSEPGTYTVTVTGANGCSASAMVPVSQDIAAPAVSATVDRMLTCSTTEAVLTATISGGRPPYAIEWTRTGRGVLGTESTLKVEEPGTYTVTVVGTNGCSTSASVEVMQDVVTPVVDAGPGHMLTLEVQTATLTATITDCPGPHTVTWTDMFGEVIGSTGTITVDRPGAYTVTVVRTDTGCSASDEVLVNSDRVSEVLLESGIEGLAVFGQLTYDGVPIPESVFYFHTESIDSEDGVELATVSVIGGVGEGYRANGAEVFYLIPGNSIVSFQIHKDQFVAGKKYWLVHLPIDPAGQAAVAFF